MTTGAGARILTVAGACSAAVAVFHAVMVLVGPRAYRYFGAGEDIASAAERGSMMPALLTLGIALVFGVFAAYAFSGAGRIRRLPLLRAALVAISAIYTVRGTGFFVELAGLIFHNPDVRPRFVIFSFVALVIGILHVLGTRAVWRTLSERRL